MKQADRNRLVRSILDNPVVYDGVTYDPVETEDYAKVTASGGTRVYTLAKTVTVTVRLSTDRPRLHISVSTYNTEAGVTFYADNHDRATDLAVRFINLSIEALNPTSYDEEN